MQLNIAKDIEELSMQVAEWISSYIGSSTKTRSRFTFLLSGGSTPEKLYRLLASEKFKNKVDWSRLHFFWGDERCVPFNDHRNNARMAFEALLDHVPVPKENIHPINTAVTPERSAAEYESLLHQYFPDNQHSFDLALMGLGDDAHTLSLFPGSAAVMEKKSRVMTVYNDREKMYRVTLTAPVINAAGRVVFLVSGASKAGALHDVMTGPYDPEKYPAQVICPFNDELYWWVDKAAAAGVE